MIKDIVVNLTVGAQRDAAADFALSMAREFGAHVAGTSFCYDMVVPGSVFGSVATGLVQAQRAESEKIATAAISGFEQNAKLAGVSYETRLFHAPLTDAVEMFGRIARRYDVAVVAQPSPEMMPGRAMVIEAALFQSGPPGDRRALHSEARPQARPRHGVLGRQPQRRARGRRCDADPEKAKSRRGRHGGDRRAGKRARCRAPTLPSHLARHNLKVELSEAGGRRHRRAEHDTVARGRRRDRLHRHGRLRPFALAGIRARRRDPRNSQLDDGAGADVALKPTSHAWHRYSSPRKRGPSAPWPGLRCLRRRVGLI